MGNSGDVSDPVTLEVVSNVGDLIGFEVLDVCGLTGDVGVLGTNFGVLRNRRERSGDSGKVCGSAEIEVAGNLGDSLKVLGDALDLTGIAVSGTSSAVAGLASSSMSTPGLAFTSMAREDEESVPENRVGTFRGGGLRSPGNSVPLPGIVFPLSLPQCLLLSESHRHL